MFRKAGSAEIIRSHQKDELYRSYLRSSVGDVILRIAGPLRWIQWRKELDTISDVLYFALTTLGGYQTIGEEYVNIIMVDETKRALPSKWRRTLMIFLQVCIPYILNVLMDKLERRLQSTDPLPLYITETEREKLLQYIPVLRQAVNFIHRLHLSIFYIRGVFYHLSKHFTGIHYVRYMSKQTNTALSKPFRLLGYLALSQLAAGLTINLYHFWKTYSSRPEGYCNSTNTLSSDEAVHPSMKCCLCLGLRRRSTLTPCGHLFCWNCIHEWFQSKPECPLCREQFPRHRLVALQNFDPV